MFKRKRSLLWFLVYILVVLVVAGSVNSLMYLSIPTESSLDGPSWLAFWGSYLGGAIGCIPAILALLHSISEADRQHKEMQNERRLSALPVFDCRICHFDRDIPKIIFSNHFFIDSKGNLHETDRGEYHKAINAFGYNFIDLCNCGPGSALQVKLFFNGHSVDLFNLKHDYTAHYILNPSPEYFNSLGTETPVRFVINFQDIFGNQYSQEFFFNVSPCSSDGISHLQFKTVSIGSPQLLPPDKK